MVWCSGRWLRFALLEFIVALGQELLTWHQRVSYEQEKCFMLRGVGPCLENNIETSSHGNSGMSMTQQQQRGLFQKLEGLISKCSVPLDI